jgi:hypothetical protein
MSDIPRAVLEAEFDTLMTRAGVTVPEAARSGILAAYADLRGQLTLLHTPLPATVEPAHVFRMPLQ